MARWRRAALAMAWVVTAMWGIYYLATMAASSAPFVAAAVAHFVIGYAFASALVARPMSMPLALFATVCAGALTRVALGMGTGEMFFVWAGPLAAIALGDATSARNVVYSALAFIFGFLALIWLVP